LTTLQETKVFSFPQGGRRLFFKKELLSFFLRIPKDHALPSRPRLFDCRMMERLHFLWRAVASARVIHASGMFDPVWYAASYKPGHPLRLLMHYVLRGAAEGRSPSAAFDGDWYLRAHPEVGTAGQNPLAHYATQGRHAGYATHPATAGLPRQPYSQPAYTAWLAEMDRLTPPATDGPSPIAILREGQPDPGGTPYLLLVPAGVGLTDQALPVLSRHVAASPAFDLVFADEDQIDPSGARHSPWFKPGLDPELMLAGDLTGPATLMRRTLLERLGWDGVLPDAAALRRLGQAALASGACASHCPAALFHRPTPPRLEQPVFAPPEPRPLVSLIIPTRDRARLLATAVDGILDATEYAPLEVLIVDNDSRECATAALFGRLAADPRVRILRAPGAFNWSSLNNQAARQAHGKVLVLLNNDVEIISPGWLTELVAHAMRPEIGIAGAKLLYPDRTVQHLGMTLDPAGCFCHIMRGAPADACGFAGELGVTRGVAAVTGACLAIRREMFFAVGALEENELAVTSNDIDLCLRVRHAGFRVVVTPACVLLHHEAASRGHDGGPAQRARVLAERDYLRRQWGALAENDPYMNPNLCLLFDRPALESPRRVIERTLS
jgi:GT2 family glycosyltransferase